MEFTKLSEVEVVETATDTDKVLIEQNGEIKRVPKTEVGGSGGGNMLFLSMAVDLNTGEFTLVDSNMSLDEALVAMNNDELTGGRCIVDVPTATKMYATIVMMADGTANNGFPSLMFAVLPGDSFTSFMWTSDGITMAS